MSTPHELKWATLLKKILEEVRGLLLSQGVFSTIRGIHRHNPDLHQHPGLFWEWTKAMYGAANAAAIRRLAGEYKKTDVSLLRLLDLIIPHASDLYSAFGQHFPDELLRADAEAAIHTVNNAEQRRRNACNRMINKDRKQLVNANEKVRPFASCRVAHKNPAVPVTTNWFDLDAAIDTVTTLTEKYLLLILDKQHDLRKETKSISGWEKIFLVPWATPEILALPLWDMPPPTDPS